MTARTRDQRPTIYGVLNIVFVALYVVLAIAIIPGRHVSSYLVQWGLVGLMALCAFGSFWRHPRGWLLAVVGCTGLLVLEVVLLVLVLASASFLAGVYGAFGKAAMSLALVVAALSIELVALLPALQLKFLLTKRGRRAYRR